MTQDKYFYVVVRTDLSLAQQLCQAVHAAHESGIKFGDPSGISSVVICSVADEQSLLAVLQKADSRGIRTTLFREPDINNQATAFSTEPIAGSKRKTFSNLGLWGKQ